MLIIILIVFLIILFFSCVKLYKDFQNNPKLKEELEEKIQKYNLK